MMKEMMKLMKRLSAEKMEKMQKKSKLRNKPSDKIFINDDLSLIKE